MAELRIEHDLLGSRELPQATRYGIHTQRALENFPLLGRPAHPELLKAFGAVKLAAFRVNHGLGHFPDPAKVDAIAGACQELLSGQLLADLPVDALQGGAGTSTRWTCQRADTRPCSAPVVNRPRFVVGGL